MLARFSTLQLRSLSEWPLERIRRSSLPPPVLAQLKSATPEMKALATRVNARRSQAQKKSADLGEEVPSVDQLVTARTQNAVDRAQPRKVPRSKRKKS